MLLSNPESYQLRLSFQLPVVKSPNFWTLFVSASSSLLLRDIALAQPLGLIPLTQVACLCGSPPCSSLSSHHRPVLWLAQHFLASYTHATQSSQHCYLTIPYIFSIPPHRPTTEALLLLSSSNLIYFSHVPTASSLFDWAPSCAPSAPYSHYTLLRALLFIIIQQVNTGSHLLHLNYSKLPTAVGPQSAICR